MTVLEYLTLISIGFFHFDFCSFRQDILNTQDSALAEFQTPQNVTKYSELIATLFSIFGNVSQI